MYGNPNLFVNLLLFTKGSFKIELALLCSIICKWIYGINWACILSIWQLVGKSTRFSRGWTPGLIFLAFINWQYARDNFCFMHCQSTLSSYWNPEVVIIIVIITERSIVDVAAALDLCLETSHLFWAGFYMKSNLVV